MWQQLRRFNALDRDARWMFLRAAVLLAVISLSLRVRGLRFTQTALQKCVLIARAGRSGQSSHLLPPLARQKKELAARMVRAAVRRSPNGAACLEESLALWALLQREGIEAGLRIGARKIASNFEAHAWVECDGAALNQAEDVHRHYAVFDVAFTHVAEAQ